MASNPAQTPATSETDAARGEGKRLREKGVGFLLRRAHQRNLMLFQRMSIDPALTSVQMAALHVLFDGGPASLTVIGRRAAIDPATVSTLVERLKDRGLIQLSADRTDRRKVIAALRPAGRRLVENMIPMLDRIAEATMERLSVAERVALVYLLDKISRSDSEPDLVG